MAALVPAGVPVGALTPEVLLPAIPGLRTAGAPANLDLEVPETRADGARGKGIMVIRVDPLRDLEPAIPVDSGTPVEDRAARVVVLVARVEDPAARVEDPAARAEDSVGPVEGPEVPEAPVADSAARVEDQGAWVAALVAVPAAPGPQDLAMIIQTVATTTATTIALLEIVRR